jgi:S1-C subfamily serine protease
VALLRIAATGLHPAPLGDARTLRVGDWVLAAGSPYRLPHSWSAGIVGGLHRGQVGVGLGGHEDFIQTDAAANVGNSGGPLVDASGRVVGMMTAILSRTGVHQGISLAVPIEVVVESAARIRGGGAERGTIGVVVRDAEVRGARRPGLEVTRFHPGSPAPGAGLRPGDVILAVNGTLVHTPADLQRAVWSVPRGGAVVLDVERSGARLRVTVPVR